MSVFAFPNCVKVSTVFITLLFLQSVQAQGNFTGIDQQLASAQKSFGGNVAVMIYANDKMVYQKSLGKEFNVKTQVPIGASSQWLTAALVMTYVDQGKVSLDDKVGKYIPIFNTYMKGFITLRDCLAQLTGIKADPSRNINHFRNKKYASLEEEVADFAAKREIESNPSLLFRYSNVGYSIAARIIEIVARRSFEQLMQEKITRPLMMRNTSFSSFNAPDPSFGAVSTASDYMNFLQMILNKGIFNGKRILSEQSVAEMETLHTTPDMIRYAPPIMKEQAYGFGEWILKTDTEGKASVMASPGFEGTWPLIDRCHHYACIFVTRGNLKEEPMDIYSEIKKTIDAQLPGNCK
ncbi:MAG: beta-lactamase family protein [Bacteroidota bacterium]|nr:beta-lactamase family protein [Bacteroidota bacterium]